MEYDARGLDYDTEHLARALDLIWWHFPIWCDKRHVSVRRNIPN